MSCAWCAARVVRGDLLRSDAEPSAARQMLIALLREAGLDQSRVARRWTQATKAVLRSSRIQSTGNLSAAMAAAEPRPAALLCASAIGYYGDTGDRGVNETAPAGHGFLAELVRDWEAAADPARAAGIRVVNFRSGLVLAPNGGFLRRMLLPFRFGFRATVGGGQQPT
jgi:NAD dependent epimerase/dehydratase family enzyme